jgi:uncharacterized protein (TIGR03435 family)
MRWCGWLLLAATLSGQAPPAFDVVSIRPNRSGDVRSNIAIQPGGRVAWTNVTLESLIDVSYQRTGFDRRDVIGPDWITKDRFDSAWWSTTSSASSRSFFSRSTAPTGARDLA